MGSLRPVGDRRARGLGRALTAAVAVAILNRVRGGLVILPHRNLYYAAALVGCVTWALRRDLRIAAAIAIGYLIWGFRSWSIWIGPRFLPDLPAQPPDVRLLDAIGGHSWAGGLFARHWIMLWPLQIALLWLRPGWRAQGLVPALAALLTLSYWLGWRLTPQGDGIATAEWIAGAAWGAFVVAMSIPAGLVRVEGGRTGSSSAED